MKVITTLSLSRDGNDCYIHEEWVLAETCGKMILLHITRYSDMSCPDVKVYAINNGMVCSNIKDVVENFLLIKDKYKKESDPFL